MWKTKVLCDYVAKLFAYYFTEKGGEPEKKDRLEFLPDPPVKEDSNAELIRDHIKPTLIRPYVIYSRKRRFDTRKIHQKLHHDFKNNTRKSNRPVFAQYRNKFDIKRPYSSETVKLTTKPAPFKNHNIQLGDVRYSIDYSKPLGEGGYAKVYEGKLVKTEEKCAVRIIHNSKLKSPEEIKSLESEIRISLVVKHPNIVKIYHYEQDFKNTVFVMEHCETDLHEYVQEYNYLNEKTSFVLFSQIVSAVKYLHDNAIIHRDIKLENILLRDRRNMKIALADFGFSRFWHHKSSKVVGEKCGTPYYASPQLFSVNSTYDGQKNDIWTIAVCLFVMVTGIYPFPTMAETSVVMLKHSKVGLNRRSLLSKEINNLFDKVFVLDENERWDVHQIMASDWFRQNSRGGQNGIYLETVNTHKTTQNIDHFLQRMRTVKLD